MAASLAAHQDRCCLVHGCKWREPTCPVLAEEARQDDWCDVCEITQGGAHAHLSYEQMLALTDLDALANGYKQRNGRRIVRAEINEALGDVLDQARRITTLNIIMTNRKQKQETTTS
jgi:hypothetical protein